MEVRMPHLEGAYEQISRRLGSIEDRISRIDSRISAIDSRSDARMLSLEQKVDRHFLWLVGLIVGTWTTTILTIIFHH